MVQTPQESFLQLQSLWSMYSREEKDINKKENLLKEFLYKIQFLNVELSKQSNPITSFLSSVVEEICSFLLERVHHIISKSKLFSTSQDDCDIDGEEDNKLEATTSDNSEMLRDKHNFAQLVLRAPSDYGKIVALRIFLTHEIGHYILYFLRWVNIKLLTSQSSLCNLCINLFPNCRWNDNQNHLDSLNSVELMEKYMETIQHLHWREERECNTSTESNEFFNDGIQKNEDYLQNDYTKYVHQVRTSDEIAAVLIDLLLKCVEVESGMILSDQSMSVVCWKFAIEKLAAKEDTFGSDNNARIIKCKLLELTAKCLNNVCWYKENLGALDLRDTVAELLNAMRANTNQEIIFGINYLVFSLINNVIILSDGKLPEALRFIDEKTLEKYIAALVVIMKEPLMDFEQLFECIVDLLLKMVENANKAARTKSKKVRKKFKYNIQQHCSRSNFPCFFQNMLFHIIEHLSRELQKKVLRCLLRQGICCCLCNGNIVRVLLSKNIKYTNRRMALNFIHKKVLSTVLIRNGCENCELKYKSSEFNRYICTVYYNAVISLGRSDDLHYFIRHFRHISHLVNSDMAICIMGTIILPIFRQNIRFASMDHNCANIVLECLNIFLAYLVEPRLIKAFFNEENISLLQLLMYQYEFTRCVCELVKKGIENGTYLGEHTLEQDYLYKRLVKMQLSACRYTMRWSNEMLNCLMQNDPYVPTNEMRSVVNRDIDVSYILNISYRFWCINYELLKRNRPYRKEFVLIFFPDNLIAWVCNILCAFLYHSNEDSDKIHYNTSNVQILNDGTPPLSSKDKALLVAEELTNFDDVMRSYCRRAEYSFLYNLERINVTKESVVIFDIKNQILPSSSSSVHEGLVWLQIDESRRTHDQRGIFGRLFGFIFGSREISANRSIPTNPPMNSNELSLDLRRLTAPGECKDLLLSLFESTLAVYVRICKGIVTEAMQTNLRKIKSIILSKAENEWENEQTSTLAVMQALQSLIKIAELTGSMTKNFQRERQYEGHAAVSSGGVEDRTLASTESEGDFYSTRASLICGDSEVEFSENETEELYLTADDGYEADGEIPENSESDGETGDPWTAYTPASRYRTNVVHDGICKIVVEILFELSSKCIVSPSLIWSSNLSQLAGRLFAIRNLIGGPLFLLQGFAPILQCNDIQLIELQEAILDLIVDLNSPEVLATYFSILATKNPPIDILIKYITFISTATLKKQPSVELNFPILNDGRCIYNGEPPFVQEIERVRNYHLTNNASTPFLNSALVFPISHGKLWGPVGLTVSLWMQMISNIHHKSCGKIVDDDSKTVVYDDNMRTHIFSVGSNQAMISVYVNGNLNLIFECSRPNAELSPKSSPNDDANNSSFSNNKENVPLNGSPPNSVSPFRNALKQTKKVILNSFNPMHLFNSNGFADGYFEGSSVELKYYRLCKGKWTHLCLAIDVAPDRFNLTLIADGLEQHSICLPFRNVRNLTRTSTFQVLSVGDSIPKPNPKGSRSTLDTVLGTPLKYSISNIIMFNRKIADRDILHNLTAMGPDFVDLTLCQVGGWKPNFGYLNLNKSMNINIGNFHEAMKTLKYSRFFTYSPSEPFTFMGYDHTYDRENNNGRKYDVIIYGDLLPKELKSIHTSTRLCGGLSCFLYLFARVVELTNESIAQSMALDLLLMIAHSEMQLYTEFMRNDYVSLIGYVIKTEKCAKDVNLLSSIVNNACTQPVILRRALALQVNENTVSCIAHPILLVSILHRYSDWYKSGSESCEVLEMLFKAILALVRDKHPCKEFNIKQLNRVGMVKELLNLCKVYVVESPNPVYISVEAADSFVNILSIFAGSPPSASLMDEIMKLLLLLHKPSECFVVHDRSKFYFLLSSENSGQDKCTGLQISKKPFGPSFGERRHSATFGQMPYESPKFGWPSGKGNQPNVFKNLDLPTFEKIVDCSKLNKKALLLLKQSDPPNWKSQFRRHSMIPMHSNGSPKILPHGVIRKRNRTTSRSRRNSDRNSDSCPESSSEPNPNANQPNNSLNCPMENFSQMKPKSICKMDFYKSPGIIKLQERLLTLLKDFLCLLPDSVVEEVLTHYVRIEIILVLSNHTSPNIRAAILKLLSALSKRVSSNELAAIIKKFYPQHLANQLAIYPTDVHMFETCLEWVTGLYGNLDAFINYESISINNKLGLNALLSIITQSVGQSDYAEKAFKVLRIIYVTDPENNQCLLENGLLQCCLKTLYNMYTKTTIPVTSTENAIVDLLTAVGEKSLKTVGQVNIIWDILNMLNFYQEGNPINVIKGFRSVQGKLQLNWLNLYLKNQKPTASFKVVILPNSSLTLSETKTRLDLLIDRCFQFFTTFGPTYMPSENEIKLFELLVLFGISTNSRCNNFIAWGLLSSRPIELRKFIIDTLWISCQNETLPSIICDGKIIKSFLWQCLREQKSNNEENIENLENLCLRLGIRDTDTMWNLEHEQERIELIRHNISAKHKSMLDKTIHKFESLAGNCIETSMAITRVVTELQNSERTNLMNHMREYDENYTFHKWLEIIRRMTHEGAPWYSINRCETSFELDDTEGPSRVHNRLRRCHLDIDKRFIMNEYEMRGGRCSEYIRPLDYLISSYDQQLNISMNSQILYNFPAKYLPVDAEIDGEIVVTNHKLYFIATYKCKYFYVSCDVANITEIWLKRYQHQEKAFEIFLDTNKSLFFSLQHQDDWKIMKDIFLDKIVTCPDQNKILLITQQWREGLLTNWEYIMTLNQFAGRTYNDLMQYPVFPWILSNYTSDVLDLTEKKNFRKLEKPIAVQHEENEQHYVNNYMYINNTMTNMGTLQLKPYHYSSHYSNSGTVLHFLVRVPPFTSYFLRYQDNNFDLPDRTFHSLATTWSLASKDSPTDVKELIPEFFCLPEMFENFERFNFGCRQSGERVEDVLLPPWCLRDPRLFILIHRQALESEMVRQNIHHWIDLIFGYNQTGQNAVDAINVFHPATYSVFLESEITDPIERKAVETMIKTYGQMPKQLFKSPHPSSKQLNYCLGTREVFPTVKGLRWGVFLGSPQLPPPSLGHINKLPDAESLISFNNTNMIYGLPSKSCVMQGPEADTYNVISWDNDDRIVRIQPLNEMQATSKALLHNSPLDEISCCGSDPNSNLLWCGHKSGMISVYKCLSIDQLRVAKSRQNYVKSFKLSYNSATFRKLSPKSSVKMDDIEQSSETAKGGNGTELTWLGPTALTRHTDEITSISLSVEFKIAVSAGRDGLAVIWDLNDLSYIRTIERPAEIHHSPISLTAISPTLGDIVTVHSIPKNEHESYAPVQPDECFEVTEESLDDFVNVSVNPNGKSILRLHTVNARYVNHIVHEDLILAVCYSYIKEGVGVNVIATAVEGGIIRLWSSWNLSMVTEIITGISNIKSITYSTHQHLVVLTKDSYIQVWEAEGLYGNPPKFPQIVFK